MEKTMRLNLRRQAPRAALAVVLALAVTPALMAAQAPEIEQPRQPEWAQDSSDGLRAGKSRRFAREASRIEGVWEAQVTRRVCATGAPVTTFRGMTNFIAGGALIGTNSNPNPPTTYGRWQYLGSQRYIAVERLFRYNPDGSFAGVQRITRNITFGSDGNQFTGINTSEVFDVDGNLIATGCSTDVSRRVE
jgi:hypothetical protein